MLAADIANWDYRQSMFALGPKTRLGEAGICQNGSVQDKFVSNPAAQTTPHHWCGMRATDDDGTHPRAAAAGKGS